MSAQQVRLCVTTRWRSWRVERSRCKLVAIFGHHHLGMSLPMPADRRQCARCRIENPAYASIARGTRALIIDASERGVALQSQAPLLVQSCVEAKLDLAEGEPTIVAAARVAWSDGRGSAGLEFIDLSRDSRSQLQRWLRLNGPSAIGTEPASARVAIAAHDGAAFPKSSADEQLSSAAERALLLTHAHGSAIALRDGQSIVCRAAAGELAPPIGSKMDPQSGISGACLRLGRLLVCNCAESDPHVDLESCRILGISSIIAAPIRDAGATFGLIEVFSRDQNAFDISDCYALERLAEFVAASQSLDHCESLDDAKRQPHWGAAQKMGVPWRAAQAAPLQSADVLTVTSAPISSDALVAGLDEASPRFIRPRGTFWMAVATLIIVALWLSVGTRVRSSKAAPPTTARNPYLAPHNQPPSPSLSSVLPVPAIPVQPDSAEELRRKAERGDANAQFQLGAQYASSDNKKNYAQAVKWLTISAENGNVLASATLGAFYWAGRGVPQDYVKAYMWSAIAKAEGDQASAYRVAILESRLSPTELAEAELLAAAWLRIHRKEPTLNENAPARRQRYAVETKR
jgi:GAF domain/PilZ domain